MLIKHLPVVALVFFCMISASAQFSTPRAAVVELYRKHDAKESPFWQSKSRARVDRYFTRKLADLIWKDAHGPKDEAPTLDGDPLYNAQDTSIKAFRIGAAVTKGNSATVPVSFTNFGEKNNLKFLLKRVGPSWKIDNIYYDQTENLLNWLGSDAN